jgi:hypothetical protein
MVINDYAVREKDEKMSVLVADCSLLGKRIAMNVMRRCTYWLAWQILKSNKKL